MFVAKSEKTVMWAKDALDRILTTMKAEFEPVDVRTLLEQQSGTRPTQKVARCACAGP